MSMKKRKRFKALLPKDYIQRCAHKNAKSLLATYKEMGIKGALCRNCDKWVRLRKEGESE